jgi:hypothetical protein
LNARGTRTQQPIEQVEVVAVFLHQRAPGLGFAVAPLPGATDGKRLSELLAPGDQRFAYGAVADQRRHASEQGRVTVHQTDLQNTPRALPGVNHTAAANHGNIHRLLTEHVLARGESIFDDLAVRVIRSRNYNRFDFRHFQNGVVVVDDAHPVPVRE